MWNNRCLEKEDQPGPDSQADGSGLHQVGGEVVRRRALRDGVSKGAELLVGLPVGVGRVADDGLRGSVLSTPVSPPAVLLAVCRQNW